MYETLLDALQYYGAQIDLEYTARLLRKKMARDELRFIVQRMVNDSCGPQINK